MTSSLSQKFSLKLLSVQCSQKLIQLFLGQMPPLPACQSVQGDIHDPGPFQAEHPLAQLFAHPADLQVKSLGQNDPEFQIANRVSNTGFRNCSENGYAAGHRLQEFGSYRLVDSYAVFLLMMVLGTHHFVYDIPIIRH
ncbi:hypothetical protein D3C81_1527610 [compost metagenome]